jgi:succinate dehydrogenase / fumarate reductase, iron-sulfur subunit
MRNELFGSCTNHGECEAVCPKRIPLEFIGKMNRDLMRAVWHRHREPLVIPSLVQLPSADDSHEQFHEGAHTQLQEQAQQHLHEEVQAHVVAKSPEPAATRRGGF